MSDKAYPRMSPRIPKVAASDYEIVIVNGNTGAVDSDPATHEEQSEALLADIRKQWPDAFVFNLQWPPVDPDTLPEFGIVANVIDDRIFRAGAKAWLVGGTGGEGWYRFEWMAINRQGRYVRKWAPTKRFTNFRAKWAPPLFREQMAYIRGTRAEMEAKAAEMNAFVAGLAKA